MIANLLLAALAAAPSGAHPRLAVMAVGADGVAPELAAGVTETLATAVEQTGVFESISPKQLASLLAYEKRKEALGGCAAEDCYVQVGQLVKAKHLASGSVARVGEKLVLNLVLMDTESGKAVKRTSRETPSATELLSEVGRAAIVLLQPLLAERQGYLRLETNVPEAVVSVDDERRIEGVGQVIPVAAGPHTVRITAEGFYAAVADVHVQPGLVHVERVSLIPAKETISAYETKASLMRYGAYAAGAIAVGAGIASAVFYANASDDKHVVDAFAASSSLERADAELRARALTAQDDFSSGQSLYLVTLGTAVVAGGTAVALWLLGDDPDRYEEFRELGD